MSHRILIIGASGMLGSSLHRYFSKQVAFDVLGTVRSPEVAGSLSNMGFDNVQIGIDVSNFDTVVESIKNFKPDYVINCVGLIKQIDKANSPISSIEINSLLPHQLAIACDNGAARLIHFSTDCVFSGSSGSYNEASLPTATDIYGRSKLLGEVDYGPHLTLRTSIIGHEMQSAVSLVDWFLNQSGPIKGFQKAVFSGLPTVFVAEFLKDFILGKKISGLYHLSVEPIDKCSLLQLVKQMYNLPVNIIPDDKLVIDRSLNSHKLRELTGFTPPSWPELVKKMRKEYLEYFA